ncbi:LysM peptidoglycan-binding domain-containing protein [Aerococcaceae bacterium zg-ZJ1578]|uniref:phage tail tip lysozyme n=1 Tax=Aerococcaceae bacterium zg-252 TaxID=2796928 RepID=UPI001A1FA0D4|nr:LysM peptidoglycan-binding domain-containing protein [Aerococcaceae bacterium zg-1578]
MSTETNAKIIWEYFITRGWSKEAIAGVLGNMELESSIIPDIHEMSGGGGYGLVQWTPGTKLMYWANEHNLDYRSIYTQLKRIEYEIEQGIQFGHTQMTFKQFTMLRETPEVMAQIFCDHYERPNANYKKLYERQVSARKWYNKFYNASTGSEDNLNINGTSEGYYTIVSGDSLWKISQQFGVTVDELVKLNGFANQNVTIQVGQRIKVKNTTKPVPATTQVTNNHSDIFYTIVSGDSLWKISQQFGTTIDELVKLNGFADYTVTLHSGQKIRVKKGHTEPKTERPVVVPDVNNEKVEISYAESGQFTASRSLSIRNEPSESSPTVVTLNAGEKVIYDKVIITNKYVYISYVSFSGVRRYVPIRTYNNGQKGVIWGVII